MCRVILSVIAAVGLLAIAAGAATIYVPDEYGTIQSAIDASSNGDTIIVRPGRYVEHDIEFKGKAITVRSELGAEVTSIDADWAGTVVRFQGGEGPDSVLDGFTITNGFASSEGGGILCDSAPTIINNVIIGNRTPYNSTGKGGGIVCRNSSPTITNNTISANIAYFGGGIKCDTSSPTITNNVISGNLAAYGGGIDADDSDLTVTDNTFTGNSVVDRGGAIYFSYCTSVVTNNVIIQNAADNGGGIYLYDCPSPSFITRNVIADNTAGYRAGGICCYSGSSPTIESNMITGNSSAREGGGIYCHYSSPMITNNTFSANTAHVSGGGIYYEYSFSTTITNTIVWDNSAPAGPEIDGSPPTVTFSDVKGGWPGTGNIDADPLFVDAARGDFHLTWGSPCFDSGNNSVVTQTSDFEGDPRIAMGVAVDMGADEYWFHIYHARSVIPGAAIDVKVVGWPTAPVTLAMADSIVDPPVPTPHGDLYLPWPPLWSGSLGNVPSNGILTRRVTVPANWSSSDTYYLQSLIGPWGGPSTRLSNLLTLTVE